MDYVTAVVCIDYATVGKWAEQKGLPYTSYPELSQKQEVYNLIKEPIAEVNRTLRPSAKIVKFVNLYKEFDADDDELTRTRKLRRAFVEERYRDIIDALYRDEDGIHIDTTITYEDGRVSRIQADMRIEKLSDGGD